jgi:large subunit ribosomal protein L22
MKVLADMIRGKKVEEAIALLSFTPKVGARIMKNLLMSAVYNAENQDKGGEELYVKTVYVDYGRS